MIFDTHGESVGRGAHPGSLADRLAYLDPRFVAAGLRQGRHPHRARDQLPGQRRLSAVRHGAAGRRRPSARITEPVFAIARRTRTIRSMTSRISPREFFQTVREEMNALVDDPATPR